MYIYICIYVYVYIYKYLYTGQVPWYEAGGYSRGWCAVDCPTLPEGRPGVCCAHACLCVRVSECVLSDVYVCTTNRAGVCVCVSQYSSICIYSSVCMPAN